MMPGCLFAIFIRAQSEQRITSEFKEHLPEELADTLRSESEVITQRVITLILVSAFLSLGQYLQ
jgi:hypothetical protein